MYYDGPQSNDSDLREAEELAICPECGGGGGFHRFGLCWTCWQNAVADVQRDRVAQQEQEQAQPAMAPAPQWYDDL